MFLTADQILAHLVGDYLFQSDWAALGKYRSKAIALLHGVLYTLPFLFLTRHPLALLAIGLSHAIIDHYQIGKLVAWLHNWPAPVKPKPFSECKRNGYDPDRPVHITDWLGIITDNTLHLLCNAAAIMWLG